MSRGKKIEPQCDFCFEFEKLLNWVTLQSSIYSCLDHSIYSNYFHLDGERREQRASEREKERETHHLSTLPLFRVSTTESATAPQLDRIHTGYVIWLIKIFIIFISISPINDFKVAIIYTLGTLYNSLSSHMIHTQTLLGREREETRQFFKCTH